MENSVLTPIEQSVSTKEAMDQTVDMLRTLADLETETPVEQLRSVMELTARGHDPRTIAAQLDMTRDDLGEIIRAIGRRFRARMEPAPEGFGTMLFPTEPDPDVLAGLTPRRRKKALSDAGKLRVENPLPASWQIEFHEVGVRKAVAAIRTKTTPEQDLAALALRIAGSQVPPSSGLVTFPALRASWMLIQLGQLDSLSSSPQLTSRTAQTIVASYDALESVRADGVEALTQLLNDPNTDDLDSLTVLARPLAEAAITRLEQVLERTRASEGLESFRARGMRRFLSEIAGLRLPKHVGELNEGQVLRIAKVLGVKSEPQIDTHYSPAEARLIELGLEEDLPWIKGVWISAYSCNREEDFWEAMNLLVEGDASWASPLK